MSWSWVAVFYQSALAPLVPLSLVSITALSIVCIPVTCKALCSLDLFLNFRSLCPCFCQTLYLSLIPSMSETEFWSWPLSHPDVPLQTTGILAFSFSPHPTCEQFLWALFSKLPSVNTSHYLYWGRLSLEKMSSCVSSCQLRLLHQLLAHSGQKSTLEAEAWSAVCHFCCRDLVSGNCFTTQVSLKLKVNEMIYGILFAFFKKKKRWFTMATSEMPPITHYSQYFCHSVS